MIHKNKRIGNPLDGFDNMSEYVLAVATGAKMDYLTGNFNPNIRILEHAQEDIYWLETNTISMWKGSIKNLSTEITLHPEKLWAFTAVYLEESNGEKILFMSAASKQPNKAWIAESIVSRPDSIHMREVSYSDLNIAFLPLINVLDKERREAEEKKQKELEYQRLLKQKKVWQEEGACQHCGGSFKGLFRKKCVQCGIRKDYK